MHSESTLPEGLGAALVAAGSRDDPALDELVNAALSSPDPRHRVLALRARARRGRVGVAQWRAALGDPDADVRREALTLLAHDPRPLPSLARAIVTALDDPDPLVVDAAAFAAGERGCHAAIDSLINVASTHDDARCREAAVAALGGLGDRRGVATIIAALEDKAPVRRRAIVALANVEGPDVDAALARAATDRDWQVRAAVEQLAREDRSP
ncbi:MAG: HEAT repeat domain-containing protein [Acidimicrobiales bacterium]